MGDNMKKVAINASGGGDDTGDLEEGIAEAVEDVVPI